MPGAPQPDVERADVGHVIEAWRGRARALRAAVEQDVAAAVAVVDLVRGDARRAVVAEEAAAAVAGAVAAIDVPG